MSRDHLDAARLVGLLADPARRRVVAALVLESGTVADVAAAAGLPLRDTTDAVARLTSAGLVEVGSDGHLVILEEAFGVAAREAATAAAPASGTTLEPSEQILVAAFDGQRLTWMPTKRSKRLVVLDHLAQRFEPGQRYSERQVNAALARASEDTATLRRYLVDEGFLDRADGEYWRCGGTVDQTP